MKFSLKHIPSFAKEMKDLAKKYRSLHIDYANLLNDLEENPFLGTPLGRHCYKIRMAITSKGRGKSGGARVITCVKVIGETVFLIAIFDKSDMENIDDEELQNRINQIPED